ncbi:MAG: hypothetical protein ACTSQI_01575 [Candidatus Helarchaeota archaeon]
MLEIPIEDLTDWYSNKVRKKLEPPRKKVQKIFDRIQLFLNDINASCDKLTDVTTLSEHDELATKSVEQLARKYQDRINEIEMPDEPLYYEKITKFSMILKNLIQYLWQQGKRWIPKLSRTTGSTYKTIVREINYHIRDLQREWASLEGFIENKLKVVKIYENIFDEIKKMQTLLDEIDEKKEELKLVENQILQLHEEKKTLEKEFGILKENPNIIQRTKIETELQLIVQNLKGTLGYFRKPFRKFQKFLGDGNYFVRPGCSENLSAYIQNPLETFFAEDDEYSKLKIVLLELKKASSRLNLKARDEKKLNKEIDEINNGSLISPRKKYKTLYQKYLDNAAKLKEKGLLDKLEKAKEKISIHQKEIDDVELKYSRLKDNYEKNLIKMRDLRAYLEKAIHSTVKQEIKILL